MGVQAFDGQRAVGQEGHGVVGGGGHVRISEDDEHRRGLAGHEPDRGLGDQGQGSLAADEEGGEVPPVLGQEVLQRVAGDLALEAAEAGADGREVGCDEFGQAVDGVHAQAAGAGRGLAPVGQEQAQPVDVVRGPPEGHGVGAAGVVADHAAEGRPVLRGGVGPEAQPEGSRGLLQVGHDHARLDAGGAGVGVDAEDGVHVAGEIEDDPRADGVARAGRAAAAAGDRYAEFAGDGQGGGDVLRIDRADDRARRYPVVRGVRGVFGPAARTGAHLSAHGLAEPAEQLVRLVGAPSAHHVHCAIVPVPRGVHCARPPCGPGLRSGGSPGGATVGQSAALAGGPFASSDRRRLPAHPGRRGTRAGHSSRPLRQGGRTARRRAAR